MVLEPGLGVGVALLLLGTAVQRVEIRGSRSPAVVGRGGSRGAVAVISGAQLAP